MTDRKLLVSAGPHVRGGASTTSVMGDVLIALLPAVVASVLVFGTSALLLEVVCVAASILFEYLFRRITKRTNTISDLSAAVTGLLLAMNLPAGFPIWMAIVGCFVAIVIVKQLFGGIGCASPGGRHCPARPRSPPAGSGTWACASADNAPLRPVRPAHSPPSFWGSRYRPGRGS